ncbi:MAG TPA: alpha/beta hydrolase, partial [Candidatus Acidoferrum sp.]|nr:alpha/beta hydrolase [Candidatus Acidoferrum sp.]
ADDLSDVRCPVLAIFGQNDTRVPPAANLDKMRKYLTSAEEQFSIVTVPNLGHASATTQTLLGNKSDWPYGYWVWSKRPGMIDDTIARWIMNPGKQDTAQ